LAAMAGSESLAQTEATTVPLTAPCIPLSLRSDTAGERQVRRS
jgi:hypothetical protein